MFTYSTASQDAHKQKKNGVHAACPSATLLAAGAHSQIDIQTTVFESQQVLLERGRRGALVRPAIASTEWFD